MAAEQKDLQILDFFIVIKMTDLSATTTMLKYTLKNNNDFDYLRFID